MTTIWDEEKKQREKMKDKPFKEKLAYFWEYEKVPVCIIVCALIFVVAIIKSVVTSKDYALNVVMINSMADSIDTTGGDSPAEGWIQDLSGLIDYNPKKYEITIDTSMTIGADSTTANAEYASVQKLAALMSSREIDVLMANTSVFEQYAQNQYYCDLRDIYSEEELEELSDYIYYTDGATFSDYDSDDIDITEKQAAYTVNHHDPDSMTDPVPCGFFLSDGTKPGDTGMYSYFTADDTYQGYEQEGVMAIPINTDRLDAAKTAMAYFMNLE